MPSVEGPLLNAARSGAGPLASRVTPLLDTSSELGHNLLMGTDNTNKERRAPMTQTTTEVRDWTVVVRKPTANRFQPIAFEGTWAEAERLASAIGLLTELETYYLHTDTDEVHTHTGRRVAIKGEALELTDLLEPCRHSLDNIEGYRVITQISGGTKGIVFYRAHEYGLALAWADNRRAEGRQSRITNLYSCGHWSEDLNRYYTERSAS